jgi:hypothetical protein
MIKYKKISIIWNIKNNFLIRLNNFNKLNKV